MEVELEQVRGFPAAYPSFHELPSPCDRFREPRLRPPLHATAARQASACRRSVAVDAHPGRWPDDDGGAAPRRALAFIGALRARHQADQVKRGLTLDNHVRPEELSLLERSQLKDAFAVIRHHQDVLGQLYRIDRIA